MCANICMWYMRYYTVRADNLTACERHEILDGKSQSIFMEFGSAGIVTRSASVSDFNYSKPSSAGVFTGDTVTSTIKQIKGWGWYIGYQIVKNLQIALRKSTFRVTTPVSRNRVGQARVFTLCVRRRFEYSEGCDDGSMNAVKRQLLQWKRKRKQSSENWRWMICPI